jgi:hypothetical protein
MRYLGYVPTTRQLEKDAKYTFVPVYTRSIYLPTMLNSSYRGEKEAGIGSCKKSRRRSRKRTFLSKECSDTKPHDGGGEPLDPPPKERLARFFWALPEKCVASLCLLFLFSSVVRSAQEVPLQ